MYYFKTLFVFSLVAGLTISCGEKDSLSAASEELGQQQPTGEVQGDNTDEEDQNPWVLKVDSTYLDGRWQTGCVHAGLGYYLSSTLVFSEGAVEQSTLVYKDQQCVELDQEQVTKGHFEISGPSFHLRNTFNIDIITQDEGAGSESLFDIVKVIDDTLKVGQSPSENEDDRPTQLSPLEFTKMEGPSSPLPAPAWYSTQGKITPLQVPESGARFGHSVTHHNDEVIVGAPRDKNGTVTVFESKNGNSHEKYVLTPPDSVTGFGAQVAVDGDYLAVGAPNTKGEGTSEGVIVMYRFENGRWQEFQTILSPEKGRSKRFGRDFEFSNGHLVALIRASDKAEQKIVFYKLFEGQWVLAGEALPEMTDSSFGWDIAIAGQQAIFTERTSFSDAVLHVYEYNASLWAKVQTIELDWYANDISASEGRLLVTSGNILSFEKGDSGWELVEEISINDLKTAAGYSGTTYHGTSIEVKGDIAVVGHAVSGKVRDVDVLLIKHDGTSWQLVDQFKQPDPRSSTKEFNDIYGRSLSLSSSRVVIGAPNADDDGSEKAGSAYFFDFNIGN